jgi:hypothetical protein
LNLPVQIQNVFDLLVDNWRGKAFNERRRRNGHRLRWYANYRYTGWRTIMPNLHNPTINWGISGQRKDVDYFQA